MSTKYLIFDASNNWDNAVVVVELTDKYRQLLLRRMDTATKLKEQDSSFAWLQFFDGVDAYETDEAIRDWIGENTSQEDWERDLWVLSDKAPDFGLSESVRVDMAYLFVDENSCFWELRPKHTEGELSTQVLGREALEGN